MYREKSSGTIFPFRSRPLNGAPSKFTAWKSIASCSGYVTTGFVSVFSLLDDDSAGEQLCPPVDCDLRTITPVLKLNGQFVIVVGRGLEFQR